MILNWFARPVTGLALALLLVGCSAATQAPARQARSSPADARAPAIAGDRPAPAPASSPSARLMAAPAAVPPPATQCQRASTAPDAPSECESRDAFMSGLAAALEEPDAARRDQLLRALEGCSEAPAGVVRVLRSELQPEGCADVLLEPMLERAGVRMRKDVEDAALGLIYAARLSRLVRTPPRLAAGADKRQFKRYFDAELVPWIGAQAKAIQETSVAGAKLAGYGKGVVAVAAGLADMRFVEVVRQVQLPEEMARDTELSNAYYASLDEALEPRKTRGRDAALVGLRELAAVGVLRDARLEQARGLLSTLFAGRRIDALDGLLLPELPELAVSTPVQRLAARLPTFYAGVLLHDADVADPRFVRALLERGLPSGARLKLESLGLSPEVRELHAHGRVQLGQRYFMCGEFRRAAEQAGAGGARASETARFYGALASALERGPKDAAEMMLRGPYLPSDFGDVAELDELARGNSKLAGLAAYDAAHIQSLVPPRQADAGFFKALALRYRSAAKSLTGKHQKRALEQAQAAEQTARAVR